MPRDNDSDGQTAALVSAWLAVLLALIAACAPLQLAWGQKVRKQSDNPFSGNAKATQEGRSIFRFQCSFCHGLDARGGPRGADLTSGRWIHGGSESALFRTIAQGVPGTNMPANDLDEQDTWMLIAYLRSLGPKSGKPVAGNREHGEEVFFGRGKCSPCHMIHGRGGRLGPDLSGVAASRSMRYLIDSIREPSKELTEGLIEPNTYFWFPGVYDTVTAVTYDGRRVVGVPKNEDSFSLQLMDQQGQLHLFLKSDVKEVVHERKSLMPRYTQEMLSDIELQDLLAYLDYSAQKP